MMNIVLLVVLLEYWLSDDFFTRDFDILNSLNIENIRSLGDGFHFSFSIWTLRNLQINFFSLNDWLHKGFLDHLSPGSLDILDSFRLSNNRRPLHRT